MYDALYSAPTTQREVENRLRATSGTGSIRLASEYEAVFGITRLQDLLQTTVRDDDYIRGEIHRLLLNLPWSDVFTTNYDTLLERTTPDFAAGIVVIGTSVPAIFYGLANMYAGLTPDMSSEKANEILGPYMMPTEFFGPETAPETLPAGPRP